MSIISNNEYVELCNKFEKIVQNKFNIDDSQSAWYYLANDEEFIQYKDEIHIIRSIRNVCQHNNKIQGFDSLNIITPYVYKTLQKIIYLLENPRTAKDIAITNMYSVELNTEVKNVIEYMKDKKISNVPVLENNKLVGVFSENTIFSKLSDEEIIGIDENDKIQDYLKYIDIENHNSEYFDFVSINEEVSKIRTRFKNNLKEDKKLVMLFVTKHGKNNQDILGIITPWDII